jgi:transglutaminase-like putative cysteine protease
MKISVAHLTRLEYEADVFESAMDVRLGPLDDADQQVERFQLRLSPGGHTRQYVDGFGNVAHLLTSTRPHNFVEVGVRTEVETWLVDPFAQPTHVPAPLSLMERADALDPSPLVPPLEALGRMASPFRSLEPFEAAVRMCEMIYQEFTYTQGVTDVNTTVEQILDGRRGVCQDFAHLLIGLCRACGIPARYVSGYIVSAEAGPPGGSSAGGAQAPRRGSGASHAWVEAFTPSHGWRGLDPTNNLLANAYYVKVARGRDYADVPPTRGTFRGVANETLSVSVTTRVLA